MHRSTLTAALTLLVEMAALSSAWAHTIVVARPDGSDAMLLEVFSRLCGELHMYGLKVDTVNGANGTLFSDNLAEASGSAEVIGGVAFLRTPGQASARIWTAGRTTGKESLRITVSIDDADAPSLLAIRTVDLLRASLRDFDLPEHARLEARPTASSGLSLSTQAPSPAAPSGFERWTVRGGASTLWETGDLGAGFAANLGLARRISARLALELAITASVVGQAYATAAATARMRQEIGILTLVWRLVGRQRLSLDVFQGFGASYLSVSGEARPPWLPQSSSAWAAASSTGACLGLRLSEHLELAVSLAALFLLPRPVLEVANVSYPVHEPLVLVSGGFQYGF